YGSWGSSGGSWGYASYGGSWGSYGGYASSGGSWGGRHHHHRRAYRAAYYSSGGSYGSYGSSGGYYAGWGSSGGSSGGSYGSWGSSGGTVIEGPATMAPTTPPPPPSAQPPAIDGNAPAPGELPPEAPAAGDQTSFDRSATLSVHVPADAKVFVNGLTTKSTGADRRFVSSGLQAGYSYTYEVRAELVRDGRPVTETKVIKLQAGGAADVNFDMNGQEEEVAEQPVSTSLTLHVPADAKVFLSGNETQSFGETRRFSTTKLTAGGEWQDYVVRVELTRDGKTLTKVETVSLKPGDDRELTVDFDAPQVAQTKVDRQ
ncbi:MAG TPA: TIGR03000 domain-containing protein, partial [Pirellulales bacterium]|nr:TIGR03000 domain-containing protein [Pirellulales bacterium]